LSEYGIREFVNIKSVWMKAPEQNRESGSAVME
jgi:hypothetical protein